MTRSMMIAPDGIIGNVGSLSKPAVTPVREHRPIWRRIIDRFRKSQKGTP